MFLLFGFFWEEEIWEVGIYGWNCQMLFSHSWGKFNLNIYCAYFLYVGITSLLEFSWKSVLTSIRNLQTTGIWFPWTKVVKHYSVVTFWSSTNWMLPAGRCNLIQVTQRSKILCLIRYHHQSILCFQQWRSTAQGHHRGAVLRLRSWTIFSFYYPSSPA